MEEIWEVPEWAWFPEVEACEEYGHEWFDDEIPHRCRDCGYQEAL